jgi:uncharacterized glyoxalase superfamily protein PhnB
VAGERGQFRIEYATNEQGVRTWFWRLIDDFGLTIATSAQFPDEDAAKRAAKWVRTGAAKCAVVESPSGTPSVDVDPAGRTRHRQRVVPHLSYDDPFAALAWLCRVFGFTEGKRFDRGENNLTARLRGPHGGVVMISGHDDDFSAWMRERAPHFEEVTERSWPLLTHAITVIVDDVDAHFEQTERQGAAVLTAPKDQPWGVRSYAVLDPEGHQWEFATMTNSFPEAPGDGSSFD